MFSDEQEQLTQLGVVLFVTGMEKHKPIKLWPEEHGC